MIINKDFALRQVADAWVVLPFGDATVDFNGMLKLNESGALLWKTLEQGCSREALVDALTKEYQVDPALAADDVDAFLAQLRRIGCLGE